MIRAYETGLLTGHYPQNLVEWVGIEPTCREATGLQPARTPLFRSLHNTWSSVEELNFCLSVISRLLYHWANGGKVVVISTKCLSVNRLTTTTKLAMRGRIELPSSDRQSEIMTIIWMPLNLVDTIFEAGPLVDHYHLLHLCTYYCLPKDLPRYLVTHTE